VSFEEARWYVWIFFGVFFPGIGIPPLPEELAIITAASVGALRPELWTSIVWLVTVAAVLSADAVLYWFGRICGPQLFERRLVQKILKPERLARLRGGFGQHGVKILLTARLVPPIRAGAFILAGAVRYSFPRFLLADGIYAVFGITIIFFGSTGVVALLRQVGWWAVLVFAICVGGYMLYRYYIQVRRRATIDSAPPLVVSVLELAAKKKSAEDTDPVRREPSEMLE
jgi:membrane protein DedA with SNARE-associated domain